MLFMEDQWTVSIHSFNGSDPNRSTASNLIPTILGFKQDGVCLFFFFFA
jgi:hypothetical protein